MYYIDVLQMMLTFLLFEEVMKKLEYDKKKGKQLNNNPKLKNFKFFTCKMHDALT
jgi:hypothetical protein